jgi:hypothetical protein
MKTICSKCGLPNQENSNFCSKCGWALKESLQKKEPNAKIKRENVKNTTSNTPLWDVFVSLHDSKDEERQVYLDLTSDDGWNFLNRLSTNIFEKFIEDNKDELNKQPYRLIESLKTNFSWALNGGYWIFLAEEVRDKGTIPPYKAYVFENIGKEWEEMAFENFSRTYEDIKNETKDVINRFLPVPLDSVLNSSTTAKDLTNGLVEMARTQMVYCVVWGYIFGLAESKYRD